MAGPRGTWAADDIETCRWQAFVPSNGVKRPEKFAEVTVPGKPNALPGSTHRWIAGGYQVGLTNQLNSRSGDKFRSDSPIVDRHTICRREA